MVRILGILFLFISSNSILGQVQKDTFLTTFEETIYFESDRFEINKQASERIALLVDKSLNLDSFRFYIHAHTDQVGSEEYNLRLSKKRMESVKLKLLEAEIDSNSIFADYHGEEMLEYDNDEDNRRASIRLQEYKELILLSGKIIDDSTFQGISADIFIKSGSYKIDGFSNSNGQFSIPVPLRDTIDIEIQADGFFIETNSLPIHEGHKSKVLTIPLPKLKLGRRYLFRGMNFYGDRNLMIEKSAASLRNLIRFMQNNEDQCIEISGHVNRPSQDSVSLDSYSYLLSVSRALRVKDELIKEGISPDRMLAKGYGNWRMLFPRATTLEEQEKNRRVEIEIQPCSVVEKSKDDFVANMDNFKINQQEWVYDPENVKTDVSCFSNNFQLRFWLALKKMTDKGIDPTGLTYWEIVISDY